MYAPVILGSIFSRYFERSIGLWSRIRIRYWKTIEILCDFIFVKKSLFRKNITTFCHIISTSQYQFHKNKTIRHCTAVRNKFSLKYEILDNAILVESTKVLYCWESIWVSIRITLFKYYLAIRAFNNVIYHFFDFQFQEYR